MGEAVAFVKTTDPKLFPPEEYGELEDSTSGIDAPDIEFFSSPTGWTEHGHGPVPAGGLMTLSAYITRFDLSGMCLRLKGLNNAKAD